VKKVAKRRKREKGEGENEKSKSSFQPKREDIEAAKSMLQSIASSFALQAGFILPQLKQLGCDMKPAVYYPEKGNAVYLGYKLVLPSEEAAKYLSKCFELAAEEIKKK
jgi:hypothetical protein